MSHHGDDSHAAARAQSAVRCRPGRGQRHRTLSSSVEAVALRGAAARPRSGQEAMWAEVPLRDSISAQSATSATLKREPTGLTVRFVCTVL
jgi:hypothetical protein